MTTLTTIKRLYWCALLAVLLSFPQLLAQCQIGQNQSDKLMISGPPAHYSAFPKFGARLRYDAMWQTMSSSGIRYVYCNLGPTSSNCQNDGSDFLFTAGQKTAMNTAFSNWTGAKTANGSNLLFTNVSSSGTNILFAIRIKRMSTIAMGSTAAQVTTRGAYYVDYNGDGVYDDLRLGIVEMEVRETEFGTDLTQEMAHEIGHVMGLADCLSCNNTTVMSYNFPGALSPSTCDNNQVHTLFP